MTIQLISFVVSDLNAASTDIWPTCNLSDWSMERWFHGRYTEERDDGAVYWPAYFHVESFGVPPSGFGLNATGWFLQVQFNGIAVMYGDTTSHVPDDMDKWFYLAANFDRSGNATLYLNAVPILTLDISAGVAVNVQHVFDCGGQAPGAEGDAICAGPMAYHTRLMTLPEIRESYRQGTVMADPDSLYAIDHRDLIAVRDYSVDAVVGATYDAYIGHTPPFDLATDSPSEYTFANAGGLAINAYWPNLCRPDSYVGLVAIAGYQYSRWAVGKFGSRKVT